MIRVARRPRREQSLDSDNDGVAEYLDGPGQPNVLPERRGVNNQFLAEPEPGLKLVLNADNTGQPLVALHPGGCW